MLRFVLACFLFSYKSDPKDCPAKIPLGEFWNDTEVNYYVDLIDSEQSKALNFTLPTNNEEFLKGSDIISEANIDFGAYDFIVVGAGTAGSILAYKLSDIANWKVLLIEAGGNETDFSEIPSQSSYLQYSRFNWGYYTSPQENSCRGRKGYKCTYARGKALGGSGAINGVGYFRGNRYDYDTWSASGSEGWSFDDLLPYFIDLENTIFPADPQYRGKKGSLLVDYPVPHSPLLQNFLEANEEVGLKTVDYNAAEQIGAAPTQFNIANGRRVSGGSAFVTPGRCRDNLKVVQLALVTKVLINKNNEAYGVEFTKFGVNYTASARKEVILSAGAINTPQLLLLSGVGPKEELKQVGINVVQDLPGVGRNLQDHVIFTGLTFNTNTTASDVSDEVAVRMYLAGFGPYTLGANCDGSAFFKVNSSSHPEYVPDIQLAFLPPSCVGENEPFFTNANSNVTSYLKSIPAETCFKINTVLLHPKSTGSVTLASNNPFDFPIINSNFLSEEEDKQILYEGIESVFDLIQTKAFQKVKAAFINPNFTDCDQYKFRSKDYWFCYIRYFSTAGLHTTSTTAMGNSSTSVVDNRLKVYGVKNLRVADLSVIPNVISGNTYGPAFVIGAKAADIIRADYDVRQPEYSQSVYQFVVTAIEKIIHSLF